MKKINLYILSLVVLVIGLATLAPSQQTAPPTSNATRLRGRVISTTAPTDQQVYVWDVATSTWKPAANGSVTAGTGILVAGGTVSIDSTYINSNWVSKVNPTTLSAGATITGTPSASLFAFVSGCGSIPSAQIAGGIGCDSSGRPVHSDGT